VEAAVAAPAFHPGVDTRLEAKQRKIQKRLELTVSSIQSLTEKMQTLPAEKQQEVLDFIEFLERDFQQINYRALWGGYPYPLSL
jgi:hypothetical protein